MDDKKWQKYLGEELYVGGEESAGIPYKEKVALSEKVLRHIPAEKNKVLAVGCGDGAEVRWLFEHGFEACGITKWKKEQENAKKIYSLDIDYGDMHELPYKDESFNCVFAKDVYEHSIAPFIALSEFYRVLKTGGWLIVTMPSKEWIDEFYHYNTLTHYQVYSMLKKCSFNVLAGPQMKCMISAKYPLVIPLGIKRGHIDIYIAEKIPYKKPDFMLDVSAINRAPYIKFFKKHYLKTPKIFSCIARKIYDRFLLFAAKHHWD